MSMDSIIKALENPQEEKEKDFLTSDEGIMFLDMLGSGLAPDNPFAGIGTSLVRADQREAAAGGTGAGGGRSSALIDAYKAKAQIEASEAATVASKQKSALTELELGEMKEQITIVDADSDKEFTVSKSDVIEGNRLMDQIRRNAKLNLLTDEQIKSAQIRIPTAIKSKDKSGVETANSYDLSQTHYKAISEAISQRKQQEKRDAAGEKLENVSPADMMKPENFKNLLDYNPAAAAALMNKVVPEEASGLSDAQYRYYADTNVSLTQAILRRSNPDKSLINTANNLSRKLKDSHMLLKIKAPTLFHPIDGTKAVTVSLPPGVTADQIYADAEEMGVDISVILRAIYESSQEEK